MKNFPDRYGYPEITGKKNETAGKDFKAVVIKTLKYFKEKMDMMRGK